MSGRALSWPPIILSVSRIWRSLTNLVVTSLFLAHVSHLCLFLLLLVALQSLALWPVSEQKEHLVFFLLPLKFELHWDCSDHCEKCLTAWACHHCLWLGHESFFFLFFFSCTYRSKFSYICLQIAQNHDTFSQGWWIQAFFLFGNITKSSDRWNWIDFSTSYIWVCCNPQRLPTASIWWNSSVIWPQSGMPFP